jgi:hypothetical protein
LIVRRIAVEYERAALDSDCPLKSLGGALSNTRLIIYVLGRQVESHLNTRPSKEVIVSSSLDIW